MKTQEEYAREIDEIVRRDVESCQIDWLQLAQYFPNKDIEYYEAAYVRYDAYDPQTEVYSGFGSTEVESRAMLLIDLLDKKVLTLSDLNLKSLNRI